MRFLPSRTDRAAFGKIADEYDLVYFGTVDPRVDTDYQIVRGLTLSTDVRDENYTTGNVYDYEVAFLQRSRKVVNRSGHKFDRTWTMLQIQLKVMSVPHFLVDGRSRSREYGSVLASTQRWQEINWQHFSHTHFSELFATYTRPEYATMVGSLLNPEIQSMFAGLFSEFDYEFCDDKLIIYATNADINLQVLDHMLRVGLWLARQLDEPPQVPQQ